MEILPRVILQTNDATQDFILDTDTSGGTGTGVNFDAQSKGTSPGTANIWEADYGGNFYYQNSLYPTNTAGTYLDSSLNMKFRTLADNTNSWNQCSIYSL